MPDGEVGRDPLGDRTPLMTQTADAAHEAAVDSRTLANAIRALAMDAVEAAKSGHPGMPMGFADVATVLFDRFLKFDAAAPDWPDRDRLILSAGHGSMLLYALLHLTGYEAVTLDQIKRFRQLGSLTPGHPEHGLTPGVETTTGPLGQGLANAVGMALAERAVAARFGEGLCDHYTYVIAGDGCLMEGISHEAITLAGHQRLGKLIVLYDDNRISIDGSTDLADSTDPIARFTAAGWDAVRVDGHDMDAVAAAIDAARRTDRPSMIACRTVIGFGAPAKAGTAAAHGAPLGQDEIAGARQRLGWVHGPFEVPEGTVAAWREIGSRGRSARLAWETRRQALAPDVRAAWETACTGQVPAEKIGAAVRALKANLVAEAPSWATRRASQAVLEALVDVIPEMVGGSADLSGSNNTKVKGLAPMMPDNPDGRYVHYGVREHAMAAAMTGMALHGGVVPYGGTFLSFADYNRPAIRLAALMEQRVIHVMTHDSIGLGEDGPTHQPVEHLAALRAISNLDVYRPADAVETAECWEAALTTADRPAVLALSRQNVPLLRTKETSENLSARGGYVLADADGERDVTLLATGTEVSIAVDARALLAERGVRAAVVSLPCWEQFARQPADIRAEVLGTAPRIAVEAAAPFGWTRFVDSEDDVVGIEGYGASAPYQALYDHFGITAEAVAARALAKLDR